MSSAAIYPQAYRPMPAPERRIGYSVAASGVVHGLLIIALASVRPTFTLSPTLLGLPGTLQVQLTEQTVPMIANRKLSLPADRQLRNFDIFDVALNHVI